jgi:hypothetical protein
MPTFRSLSSRPNIHPNRSFPTPNPASNNELSRTLWGIWLILEQTGVRDFHTRGSTTCFSFLLNMNQLFEQFVKVLRRRLLEPQGYRVKSQQKDGSIIHNAITNKLYAKVIPDLRVITPSADSFCIDVILRFKRDHHFALQTTPVLVVC